VSTDAQDTTGQLERLIEYANAHGYEIVGRYEDHVSGKNDDRPRLTELMADAGVIKNGPWKRPKFDIILVTKLDRMMRSLTNMEALVTALEGQGVGLIAIDQGINTVGEDTTAKLVRHIISAVAEWEREMIVCRVKGGMAKAKRHGTRTGRPFGRPSAKVPQEAILVVQAGGSVRKVAASTISRRPR
jgi:DNA invertase Pin-like site-specific DNA recombinase